MKFTFDGRAIEARQGDSIAAALTRVGIVALGRRRDGTARGIFCGMGVCQECIVTVDGQPSRRACMDKVADGMTVSSQDYAPSLPPPSDSNGAKAVGVKEPQVLVVGAGPAGLAAAHAAAICGARVTLLDERATAGGQYFKQHVVGEIVDAQMREGRELIATVTASGVELISNATVWGAFGWKELAVSVGSRQFLYKPERLILATGVYERGVPMPGWTLPGYMTTGSAQTLLRSHGVVPGKRVLVAGNGPLNFQLAAELLAAGVEVAAVVEAARPSSHWRSLLRTAHAAPGVLAKGLGYVARLRRARVPIHYGSVLSAAHGTSRVESCSVTAIGSKTPTVLNFDVDTVCVGYGFLPANEIARALGCRHDADATGRLNTRVDAEGSTTVTPVYAIGDAAAFRGAHVARAQGFVTGCAVARSLGLNVPARDLERARKQLARHLAFQRALWRAFAADPLFEQLAQADTVVCRCEHVTRDAVDDAIARGASTLGAVKRRTRAGMGRCQGRYCESIVTAMRPASANVTRDERFAFAPRAPIKPVRIKDLV
jgi:NADPH-dependent 2,4-dienoyl-CoA reductase/sulfur reductase-like enzyme